MAQATAQVTAGQVVAAKAAVRGMVGLETAAKAVVQVAAVQVVAAARVIPVVTNPEVAAKAVPQSHQRNSLL